MSETPITAPILQFADADHTRLGVGSVRRIAVPAPWPDNILAAQEALVAARADGGGSVGFAAFPFDRDEPATVFVPAEVIDSPNSEHTPAGRPVDSHPRGSSQPLDLRDRLEWIDAVGRARDMIRAGQLTKVVLARDVMVRDVDLDLGALMDRMNALYPKSYRFCIDGFMGASPELLVERSGEVVRAQPMAGTLPLLEDTESNRLAAADLLSSQKNRSEHQITIDMVHESLLGWCSYLDAEPEPQVIAAGPVQHLATTVEGRLSNPMPSVLELVAALHPTPAVGGWPRSDALRVINELEPERRGRYGGPVGWFDVEGCGTFAVGIRSAQISGDAARLHAGVGVVADSDPQSEFDESEAKLAAMLNVLLP